MKAQIKQFAQIAEQEVARITEKIATLTQEKLDLLNQLSFEAFTHENPYNGELKNKIFFTYSNHYRGNSGVWMEAQKLNHPHSRYEDRGYIKGVAVDLNGYLTLKSVFSDIALYNALCLHTPAIRKSKHAQSYELEILKIKDNFFTKEKELKNAMNAAIDARVKELTGCSLRYYIKPL